MLAAMCQSLGRNSFSAWSRAKRVAGIVTILAAALVSVPALAGNRETKERAAHMACLAGDYNKGVTILSQLFLETKDYNYLYNSARCFEGHAKYPEAIARFQEVLRVNKKISDEDRAETQKHIADCQENMAKQAALQPSASPLAAAQPQPAPLPTAEPAPAAVVTTPPGPAGSTEGGSGLRIAGISTMAVGGAAIIAGLVFNLKVNSMASDFQNLNGYTDAKESDRKTYRTLGWIGFGVGAACIATGAVLYYLGVRAETTSPALALGPDGSVAAVVKGAF
jgi:tetratricopeptide (TPR) repeat protein